MTALQNPGSTTRGYDDLGTGGPALLLVPGWCGGREVFDPMAAALARHHRTVVADLVGHGDRERPTHDFTTMDEVDDLLDLIEGLGLDQVVPVTLSHAGWFAIELRRRLGAHRVPAIVLVDWMPLGTPPGFADALAGLQSPGAWSEVRGALFAMWSDENTAGIVSDYVASMGAYGFDHWSRAGREISAGFDEHGTPVEALSGLDCPTLHLYAQPADDDYLQAQRSVAEAHPWFHAERVDAHSHFPMLEIPEDLARKVVDFIEVWA